MFCWLYSVCFPAHRFSEKGQVLEEVFLGQWPFFHSNEMFKPHQVHRGNLTQILKNLVLKR